MKLFYLALSIFANIQQGESIKCFVGGSEKICPTGTPPSICAIRQNSDGTGTQQFCQSGNVGCRTESLGLTCYCDSNSCNKDMSAAGNLNSNVQTAGIFGLNSDAMPSTLPPSGLFTLIIGLLTIVQITVNMLV